MLDILEVTSLISSIVTEGILSVFSLYQTSFAIFKLYSAVLISFLSSTKFEYSSFFRRLFFSRLSSNNFVLSFDHNCNKVKHTEIYLYWIAANFQKFLFLFQNYIFHGLKLV